MPTNRAPARAVSINRTRRKVSTLTGTCWQRRATGSAAPAGEHAPRRGRCNRAGDEVRSSTTVLLDASGTAPAATRTGPDPPRRGCCLASWNEPGARPQGVGHAGHPPDRVADVVGDEQAAASIDGHADRAAHARRRCSLTKPVSTSTGGAGRPAVRERHEDRPCSRCAACGSTSRAGRRTCPSANRAGSALPRADWPGRATRCARRARSRARSAVATRSGRCGSTRSSTCSPK